MTRTNHQRSTRFCRNLAPLVALLVLGSVASVNGQKPKSKPASPSDDVQRFDFGPANREGRTVFRDDALEFQVSLKVFMAGRPGVAIEAGLPEPGRFEVELAKPNALVKIRDVRVERKIGRAEVATAVELLDCKQAEQQAKAQVDELLADVRGKVKERAGKAREGTMRTYLIDLRGAAPDEFGQLKRTYLRIKTDEALIGELARRIEELAERRANWYHAEIERRSTGADLEAWRLLYQDLLFPRIAEEYLKGLNFKPVQADNFHEYVDRVERRLEGVHLVLSGQAQVAAVARKAEDLLGESDVHRLKNAFLAELQCRFIPQTDPDDPNAQWSSGQRIACRASGVAAIRVEGRLDPERHDRVDWWIVEKYDPVQVNLDWPRDAGFRVDPPYPSEHGARLRVVATGPGAVDYHFEFRPADQRRGPAVSIHDSPAKAGAKFPF